MSTPKALAAVVTTTFGCALIALFPTVAKGEDTGAAVSSTAGTTAAADGAAGSNDLFSAASYDFFFSVGSTGAAATDSGAAATNTDAGSTGGSAATGATGSSGSEGTTGSEGTSTAATTTTAPVPSPDNGTTTTSTVPPATTAPPIPSTSTSIQLDQPTRRDPPGGDAGGSHGLTGEIGAGPTTPGPTSPTTTASKGGAAAPEPTTEATTAAGTVPPTLAAVPSPTSGSPETTATTVPAPPSTEDAVRSTSTSRASERDRVQQALVVGARSEPLAAPPSLAQSREAALTNQLLIAVDLPGGGSKIGIQVRPSRIAAAWLVWMAVTLTVIAFWLPTPSRRGQRRRAVLAASSVPLRRRPRR
jgi:hypothetical protein